jgi:O-antigen/teichoic acid export membrane protein
MSEGTPSTPSTEARVLRSTVAAYSIQFGRLLVGFLARMAMARLLLPETHGVYEEALRIVTIAAAFRDLGLPFHLQRDPRRPYGTVFAATTLLGVAVTLVLIAGAPLAAYLAPGLPAVLRVFAVWVLLDGLAVVPKAFFESELQIGRLIAPEVCRWVLIAVVSVGLAYLGWGAWSFVVADLLGAALFAAWAWARAWGKIPLRTDWPLLPGLLRASWLLFGIWLVYQLVTYIDIYVIQSFYPTTREVGLYSNAYRIAFLVATIVYPRALFPTLVAYSGDPRRFHEYFRLSTVQLLGCQVVASYFLFFNPETVIRILNGERWAAAAPILRVVAFIPFFDQFTVLGGEMLKARHHDRRWLVIMVVNLVSLVGFGIVLTARWGPAGMGAANYLLVGNLWMAWEVWKELGPRFRILLFDLATLYLLPLPFFVLVAWLAPEGSWLRFALSLAASALAAGGLIWRYHRPFRTFFGRPADLPA